MGGLTFFLLNDTDACRTVAEELQPIAERNKFAWPLTHMRFMRGWLTAQQGDVDAGVEQMQKAADEPSSAAIRTILLTLTATQQLRARQFDGAVATLDRAMNDTRVRFYEAEVMRLRGEIVLAQSPDKAAEAEAMFRQALTVAARQASRAAELRACTSLARLLSARGRKTEAHALLAPLYASFTEGFQKPDLRAASALLAELK
jgi:predicted ATPase